MRSIIIDNIQQIPDAVQKGLQLIVQASFQQGRARLTRLRNELCSDSFHAVLAWSCGRAKCQYFTATVTVVVYTVFQVYSIYAQLLHAIFLSMTLFQQVLYRCPS